MDGFEGALAALKEGKRVARTGWNGKGMWLLLIPAESYAAGSWAMQVEQGKIHWGDHSLDLLPWIGMKTADNKFVPWLASQTDMLAEDWEILDDPTA